MPLLGPIEAVSSVRNAVRITKPNTPSVGAQVENDHNTLESGNAVLVEVPSRVNVTSAPISTTPAILRLTTSSHKIVDSGQQRKNSGAVRLPPSP